MSDLSRYPPGEVVAHKDPDTDNYRLPAVFVGVDRGYAVVAVAANYVNPFWRDVDGEQPNLRRTSWKPRRVRAATVLSTYAEWEAQIAAERQAAVEAREADERREADKYAAGRELVALLDKVDGVIAYVHQGGVHIGGGPEGLRAAAKALTEGLGVTA